MLLPHAPLDSARELAWQSCCYLINENPFGRGHADNKRDSPGLGDGSG